MRRVLYLGGTVVAVAAVIVAAVALQADDSGETLGRSGPATPGLEIAGIIHQDGLDFSATGFLTHVAGLEPRELFTDPAEASASNAYFTFVAEARLSGRAIVDRMFQIAAPGTLTIYFHEEPGSDFDTPSTFASGVEVASYDVRFQNHLVTIGPDEGIASGGAHLVQRTSSAFDLGDSEYRMGETGLVQEMTYTGRGTRTDAERPASFVEFGGQVVTR